MINTWQIIQNNFANCNSVAAVENQISGDVYESIINWIRCNVYPSHKGFDQHILKSQNSSKENKTYKTSNSEQTAKDIRKPRYYIQFVIFNDVWLLFWAWKAYYMPCSGEMIPVKSFLCPIKISACVNEWVCCVHHTLSDGLLCNVVYLCLVDLMFMGISLLSTDDLWCVRIWSVGFYKIIYH